MFTVFELVKIFPPKFLLATALVTSMSERRLPVDPSEIPYFLDLLEAAKTISDQLGLRVCFGQFSTLAHALGGKTDCDFRSLCFTAGRAIHDELNTGAYIQLQDGEAELFYSAAPFGQKVSDQFPSAVPDIEEAAKCFALERWNAAAFHALRATEGAMKGATLAVTGLALTAGTWGTYLRKLQAASFPQQSQDDPRREFGRAVCGYVESMKRTRDKRLMHVDDELPDVATAKQIYRRVQDLMQHLAEHIDEHGNFSP